MNKYKITAALIGLLLGLIFFGMIFIPLLMHKSASSTPFDLISLINQPPVATTSFPTVEFTASPSPSLTPSPTPIPPTPSITSVSGYDQRLEQAQPNIAEGHMLVIQERFAEAIPYWDQVILTVPEYMEAYVERAVCYMTLSQVQRSYGETYDYLRQALSDIDQAIELGTPDRLYGDLYYHRHSIYADLAGMEEQRVDVDYFLGLAFENLRMAIQLGNSNRFAHRLVPMIMFNLMKCDEGMAILQQVYDMEGRSAPPSAYLPNVRANGYLCQGKMEEALDSINQSLAIQRSRDREWTRAIILYHLGRKDEALSELNRLIEEKPYYNGYRYYLRALIYYERGEIDLAMADLDMGSGNTWYQGGLRAYVMGRIALDRGDQEEGIAWLQEALDTLGWYDHPLYSQIENELASLGVTPIIPELYVPEVTPMPTARPWPTATPSDPNFIPTPPDPIDVKIEDGTEMIYFSDYYYPVFHFQPTNPVSIQSVEALELNVYSISGFGIPSFDLFVWNPTDGQWTMITAVWGANPVENPSQYVDIAGNLYVAIKYESGMEGYIENFWITLTVVNTDGEAVVLDLAK
jgi:tetratricopeptide (TPR) repeat protein